jgi:hypothetical protein
MSVEVTLFSSSTYMTQTEKFGYFMTGQGCHFHILIVYSFELCGLNVWLSRMLTDHKDKLIKVKCIICTLQLYKMGLPSKKVQLFGICWM